MTLETDEIFAVIGHDGQLYCMECAEELLDINSIGSNQIITRDEAEREEKLYFCDVCPDKDNDQII